MHNGASLRQWAQGLLEEHAHDVGDALDRVCDKPRSAKRVHAARRSLARQEAALTDLSALAEDAKTVLSATHTLHRYAGKVRDADVLLKRLKTYCGQANESERAEIEKLSSEMRRRRKRGMRKFLSGARQMLHKKRAPVDSASTVMPVRMIQLADALSTDDAIEQIIRVRVAEMLESADAIAADDDEALHIFRLRCKQLRYALQRFDPTQLGLAAAEEVFGELVKALGAAHDCAVLARRAVRCESPLVAQRAGEERQGHLRDAKWIWETYAEFFAARAGE